MRYRADDVPPAQGVASTDDIYLMTLVLSIVIGILLTWLGIKGRQIWLAVWSGGLIVAAIATLAWRSLAGAA